MKTDRYWSEISGFHEILCKKSIYSEFFHINTFHNLLLCLYKVMFAYSEPTYCELSFVAK